MRPLIDAMLTEDGQEYWSCILQIYYKMIVTPAKAGVQFKEAWIPTFAGMTV